MGLGLPEVNRTCIFHGAAPAWIDAARQNSVGTGAVIHSCEACLWTTCQQLVPAEKRLFGMA